jgi:hypothetical protein
MPSSGKEDVVFHFAPLPKKTRMFDFLEGDGKKNFKIFGIENIDTRIKQLAMIRGRLLYSKHKEETERKVTTHVLYLQNKRHLFHTDRSGAGRKYC